MMKAAVFVVVGAALAAGIACDKGKNEPAAAAVASASASSSAAPPASSPEQGLTASSAPSADAPPPDAIIAQHILVTYAGAKRAPKGVTRTKAQAKARAEEALAKVKSGVPFEDVVKEYSEDEGSVDRMGSVGKFTRDRMDPAFSAAAFALKVGGVSDVVQTPFGFHVIKRTQ